MLTQSDARAEEEVVLNGIVEAEEAISAPVPVVADRGSLQEHLTISYLTIPYLTIPYHPLYAVRYVRMRNLLLVLSSEITFRSLSSEVIARWYKGW